jgi:MOSC domain-containing protein YiiM
MDGDAGRRPEAALEAIYIAPDAAAPVASVDQVEAVPGQGLAGDRYADGRGTWSATPGTGREVTLVESEAVEALARDHGIRIEPGQARRNLLTRGVALNDLIGREFDVGDVRLVGMRTCDPCAHLAELAGEPGLVRGLARRGGLRAEIVRGGTLRVGDRITVSNVLRSAARAPSNPKAPKNVMTEAARARRTWGLYGPWTRGV